MGSVKRTDVSENSGHIEVVEGDVPGRPLRTDFNVILFDGVCNLCNGWVRFVIRRDPLERFRFAALQSDVGTRLLAKLELPVELGTIVLIEEEAVYTQSTAVLRVIRRLKGAWPALAVLLLCPRPIRDWVYRRVANKRYKWFGRRQTCMIPNIEIENRFL